MEAWLFTLYMSYTCYIHTCRIHAQIIMSVRSTFRIISLLLHMLFLLSSKRFCLWATFSPMKYIHPCQVLFSRVANWSGMKSDRRVTERRRDENRLGRETFYVWGFRFTTCEFDLKDEVKMRETIKNVTWDDIESGRITTKQLENWIWS